MIKVAKLEASENASFSDAPIFVTGCYRSGTTLMTRLLDGHSDLLVFPIELKYFRQTDFPTEFPSVQTARHASPLEAMKSVVATPFFKAFLGLPDAGFEQRPNLADIPTSRFRQEAFERFLAEVSSVEDHHDAFCQFFAALATGLGIDPATWSQLRLVEKTPLQEQYITTLIDWFPNARFVHMVRNPYAVDVSNLNRNSGTLRRAIPTMRRSYEIGIHNARTYPDRVLVVRYEDLVTDPSAVMQRVAKHANLRFESCLQTPSILGEAWTGNSSQAGTSFTGISTKSLNSWKEQVIPLRVRIINKHMPAPFEEYDYQMLAPSLKIWKGIDNLRDFIIGIQFLFGAGS